MKDSNSCTLLICQANKKSFCVFFFDTSVNMCYYCDSFVT